MNTGDKIYYTGDMANIEGWFRVKAFRDPGCVDLTEIGGDREMKGIYINSIGIKYEGHGGTRFATEAAYNNWRNEQLAR